MVLAVSMVISLPGMLMTAAAAETMPVNDSI